MAKLNLPTLQTERLTLNKINLDDAPAMFELFSNEAVVAYYNLAQFTDIGQARTLIEALQSQFDANNGIRWAIRFIGSNRLIGSCGFNSFNERSRSTVIGYDLLPEFWRKGIAFEAVNEMIACLYKEQVIDSPINRIQADTVPGNDASEKLLLKLGFEKEGLRRQSGYWKDAYHDLNCFSLIKSDFLTLKT
ncbi:MAG: GNAT family N-acetyltransferase [Psychrosphaera sp.]|nr:GNAT family N-acetyltransferase [Psychrosphaera sp.]